MRLLSLKVDLRYYFSSMEFLIWLKRPEQNDGAKLLCDQRERAAWFSSPGAAREASQLSETLEPNLEPKNNEWVSF